MISGRRHCFKSVKQNTNVCIEGLPDSVRAEVEQEPASSCRGTISNNWNHETNNRGIHYIYSREGDFTSKEMNGGVSSPC